MLPLHLVGQDVESLSHVTARHDFNWARAAPQVATWVSLARAERWGQSGTAEGNVSRFSESREGFFCFLKVEKHETLCFRCCAASVATSEATAGLTGHPRQCQNFRSGARDGFEGGTFFSASLCLILLPSFSPPLFLFFRSAGHQSAGPPVAVGDGALTGECDWTAGSLTSAYREC